MLYFQAINPGTKGWITHEDNEYSHISEYPGNIWVTENNQSWADRVGATSLSYQEAQSIADAIITQAQSEWTEDTGFPYPQLILLPQ
jgi:23S rRNA A2030 N6-methylase RlmJ